MTDRELLDLFHSETGKERAFTLIMKKYQERIYWHIRRMVKSHDDANDLMQGTFMKIWTGLDNFRADSQLTTWIYRIATNETINHLNYHGRRPTISFDSNDREDDEDAAYTPSQYLKADSTQIDSEALLGKLQNAIESLPEKQRIVFNMRYYDEMPYEQMSEILETSVGALKASYHHAAQKIEKFILRED